MTHLYAVGAALIFIAAVAILQRVMAHRETRLNTITLADGSTVLLPARRRRDGGWFAGVTGGAGGCDSGGSSSDGGSCH